MINVFPSRTITLKSIDHPEGVVAYTMSADWADAAIRSLRTKLFRERAENHRLAYEVLAECAVTIMGKNKMAFHKRARRRFLNIADRIERGER